MNEMPLLPPELKSFAGPMVDNFPDGYMLPYTILVREAWTKHRKACIRETLFRIPKYGTLHMRGRDYVFTPERAYAGIKGYPEQITGSW